MNVREHHKLYPPVEHRKCIFQNFHTQIFLRTTVQATLHTDNNIYICQYLYTTQSQLLSNYRYFCSVGATRKNINFQRHRKFEFNSQTQNSIIITWHIVFLSRLHNISLMCVGGCPNKGTGFYFLIKYILY